MCSKRMINRVISIAILLILFVFPMVGGSAKTNWYNKGNKRIMEGFVDDWYPPDPKKVGRVAKLVSKDVTDITGFAFKKKGKWSVCMQDKDIYPAACHLGGRKNIKKYWSVASVISSNNSSLFYMDKNNNIWQAQDNENCKGRENFEFVQFFYKNRYFFKKIEPTDFGEGCVRKELENVSRFWIDKYGMAYVKNGKLYSFGTMEFKNLPDYDDTIQYFSMPKKKWRQFHYTLRCHDNIDVRKIKSIHFGIKSMYITQKDGRVVEAAAKKIKKNNKKKFTVQYKKLKVKNVKIYEDNYYIKKDGSAIIKFGDITYRMKGVKQVLNTYTYQICSDMDCDCEGAHYDRRCFVVKKNGNLYGWGDNRSYTICPRDDLTFVESYNHQTNYIPFENRYLIAENVKKVSTKEFLRNGLFYLKKSGRLYYQ